VTRLPQAEHIRCRLFRLAVPYNNQVSLDASGVIRQKRSHIEPKTGQSVELLSVGILKGRWIDPVDFLQNYELWSP
jgi:hypothetical protein